MRMKNIRENLNRLTSLSGRRKRKEREMCFRHPTQKMDDRCLCSAQLLGQNETTIMTESQQLSKNQNKNTASAE